MKVRIVFITSGLGIGGAEIMLLNLLTTLNKEKFDPYVISLQKNGRINQKIEKLGIRVKEIHVRKDVRFFFDILNLVRTVLKIKPHIAQTWMYHANLIGGAVAKLLRVRKIVWSVHDSGNNLIKEGFSTRLITRACAWFSGLIPDRILFCSEVSRKTHMVQGYPEHKVEIINNGFDLSRFMKDRRGKDLFFKELNLSKETDLLVGLIARYHPQKNLFGFLEAASMVCKKIPNAYFVMTGAGVDSNNEELTRVRDQYPLLENKIIMLGQRNDIVTILSSLDVLVLSSFSESFPMVLGEGMSCEVPCVSTNVGDCAQIIGDTGFVVAPESMLDLSNAIIKILLLPKDERKKMGQQARLRIINNFDIKKITKQYESIYLD